MKINDKNEDVTFERINRELNNQSNDRIAGNSPQILIRLLAISFDAQKMIQTKNRTFFKLFNNLQCEKRAQKLVLLNSDCAISAKIPQRRNQLSAS